MAESVMQMPAQPNQQQIASDDVEKAGEGLSINSKPLAGRISMLVQREDGVEEGKDDDELIQREQNSGQVPSVTPKLENSIVTLRGGGRPLEPSARLFFESRFGHNFSQVRVHAGPKANQMAREINARAFTVGRDMVFAQGEYAPDKIPGKRLLAHELTHVVQQQTGINRTIFRTPSIRDWDFRNSGTTSDDNCCALCPVDLGEDVRPTRGYHNGMELKAFIRDHEAGASYDIKRTKHRKVSERVGGTWNKISEAGPDADDDSSNRDECLTPQSRPPLVDDYIYSEDRPGRRTRASPESDPAATDVAYIANFTEFVEITDAAGSTSTDANSFDWHSVAWATKVSGSWEFNAANSEIEPGHRASVDP